MDYSEWGPSASFTEELGLGCQFYSINKVQNALHFTQVFFLSITSHAIPSGIEAPGIRLCSKIRGCFVLSL